MLSYVLSGFISLSMIPTVIIVINYIRQAMTLFIKINQAAKMKQRGYLYVEGSNAGTITSKQINSGSHKFNEIFRIICASTDSLVFKYCRSQNEYKNGIYMGTANLLVPILIQRHPELNLDNDFIVQLELFSDYNEPVGIIFCDLTYDKVSHYEGQFAYINKQQLKAPSYVGHPKKVTLYKGKCETKNLFSMLDPACEGQRTKFIQSFYQDEV